MGRPPVRRTDNFSKSDNNTLRQILAEGKNILPPVGYGGSQEDQTVQRRKTVKLLTSEDGDKNILEISANHLMLLPVM